MGASGRQRLSAVERRKNALQLQLAGVDLRTIAEQVGYADASAAKKAIDRAIADSISRDKEDIDSLRRDEIMRYNRLQAAFWSRAVTDKNPKAADIVLKCIAGRERLRGLQAPTQINVDAQKLGNEILALLDGGDDDAGSV
ncbi:hypothetical protein [Streptomyces sp. NRRL B-1347]|uniref:hypothetical protein n=1 Tax=Streptomyces sp. NRRL B-1347 TaxID=1476877 RepID=UPI00068C9E4B|nr:hypothetical protein [Streptomyces sp. NRRL B-1347]